MEHIVSWHLGDVQSVQGDPVDKLWVFSGQSTFYHWCCKVPSSPLQFAAAVLGHPKLAKHNRMACSPINKMGIVLIKHSEDVHRTPVDQKYFNQKAMGLQNHGPGLEKTGAKADFDHRMACSPINRMGIVLETIRGCSRDSFRPKRLQPEAIRLQNHGPGLEKTGEKANLGHRMACSTINKMGIVLQTQGQFVWVTHIIQLNLLSIRHTTKCTYIRTDAYH